MSYGYWCSPESDLDVHGVGTRPDECDECHKYMSAEMEAALNPKQVVPTAGAMAAEYSRAEVDRAHREEIAQARATLDRMTDVLMEKEMEISRLAAALADMEEALERARAVAPRYGAFEPHWDANWGMPPGNEGVTA